jgi:Sulfate permease family
MKGDGRGALGRDHVGAHREMNFAVAPGLANLSSYRRPWLRKDIVAGLVLTALLVLQGMAYAELAGLPPITGLYTSISVVGYAIFGPSKILVLGPDSALGPMIAATILPITGARGDPERAVALASALALLVGTITALAGIAHLGFVADRICLVFAEMKDPPSERRSSATSSRRRSTRTASSPRAPAPSRRSDRDGRGVAGSEGVGSCGS